MAGADSTALLLSRGSGVVAYMALSAGLVLALAVSLLLVAPDGPFLRLAREWLAPLGLGFLVLHGVLLLADDGRGLDLVDVLVPFTLVPRAWTGLRVLAGYGVAAILVVLLAGGAARRWAPYAAPLAWAAATVHIIGAGGTPTWPTPSCARPSSQAPSSAA